MCWVSVIPERSPTLVSFVWCGSAGEVRGPAAEEEIREETESAALVVGDLSSHGTPLQRQGPEPVRLPQLGRGALLTGVHRTLTSLTF